MEVLPLPLKLDRCPWCAPYQPRGIPELDALFSHPGFRKAALQHFGYPPCSCEKPDQT